ncbi:unnamed protein product [Acanthosepion pharaonis]|uniref:Uncharacterized protein n=1 Tax=Acanthosepion pharaonis TaxID=158019 RepID=A0A812AX20_ACAPH|nr:unnamed protein product [Sepia pharaonis]
MVSLFLSLCLSLSLFLSLPLSLSPSLSLSLSPSLSLSLHTHTHTHIYIWGQPTHAVQQHTSDAAGKIFTDAIENSFVREDTARAYPTTLKAFNAAQGWLHERLATSRENEWKICRTSHSIGNGGGWWEIKNPTPQRSQSHAQFLADRCWGCGRLVMWRGPYVP